MKNVQVSIVTLIVGLVVGTCVGYVAHQPVPVDYEVAYLINDVVTTDDVMLANGGTQIYVDPVELYRLSPTNIDVGNARHISERLVVLPDATITFYAYDLEPDALSKETFFGKDLRVRYLADPNRFENGTVFDIIKNDKGEVTALHERQVALP